ncbi:2-hydroxy-6-oxo-6-phenylhexa-2,4-dienoate hydrolase [Tersicoccus solisilvae]|uniref:2-hydroxy-6-oxo-6-phenylhexa-2,4-dienoate hydrolase n=1 Tax=Tersicoccus solisilvae TaxID=1882339 RepID=A0ABQ1NUU0_9MICC|nr:alpha/beta fold hydrolase [Tersicoccus solisilvae]GGC83456.1 2-hydroxy-6-oxo-6-phenylhexa-2,4-dienoate hydrolase [Tersicoccus solisilvae]
MECRVGQTTVHYVEHGHGTPVLVLHGAGVDHREAEACFDPGLDVDGLRRLYPDLPGMGRTAAPPSIRSADDVLDILLGFIDRVARGGDLLVAGHSAGAHYARALAARRPGVTGLALICPLLPDTHDVPTHAPVIARDDLGDAGFHGYFVLQTPEMLDRYERFVAPAAELVDAVAMDRIGQRWELAAAGEPYVGPVLLVAGRRDSTVGWAATADLAEVYPRATLAVLDDVGHALPHEESTLLAALLQDWLRRVATTRSDGPPGR